MNQRLTRKEMKRDDFAIRRGAGRASMPRAMSGPSSRASARWLLLAVVALVARTTSSAAGREGQRGPGARREGLPGADRCHRAPSRTIPRAPSFADEAARRTRAKELFEEVRDDYGSSDAADVAGALPGPDRRGRGQARPRARAVERFRRRPRRHLLAGAGAAQPDPASTASRARARRWSSACKAMLERGRAAAAQGRDPVRAGRDPGAARPQAGGAPAYRRIVDEYPQSPYRARRSRRSARSIPRAAGAWRRRRHCRMGAPPGIARLPMILPYRILERKRAGMRLTEEEIRAVVRGATDGSWSDGQLGAFLMAAAIRGLDAGETRALTLAMLESGERWDLAGEVPGLCDKHSTGGVGDKVSLVLAPLLASLRRAGRHARRPRPRPHRRHHRQAGEPSRASTWSSTAPRCARPAARAAAWRSAAPPAAIAPADRRLYALRDVTATVDSLPLITGSILSKKLATGAAGGGLRRQDRQRRLPARAGRGPRAGARLVETSRALGTAGARPASPT